MHSGADQPRPAQRADVPARARPGPAEGQGASLSPRCLPTRPSLLCVLWLQIVEERHLLPVKQFEDEIMAALDCNPVVIIRGATGCGKTTQVPQFILDRFVQGGRASDCNIVVTQVTDLPSTRTSSPPRHDLPLSPFTGRPLSAQEDKCCVSGRACRLRKRGGSWEKLRLQRPLRVGPASTPR